MLLDFAFWWQFIWQVSPGPISWKPHHLVNCPGRTTGIQEVIACYSKQPSPAPTQWVYSVHSFVSTPEKWPRQSNSVVVSTHMHAVAPGGRFLLLIQARILSASKNITGKLLIFTKSIFSYSNFFEWWRNACMIYVHMTVHDRLKIVNKML